nr:unnamed protein product [Callosobruchus analis]
MVHGNSSIVRSATKKAFSRKMNSEEADLLLLAAAQACYVVISNSCKKKKKRRWWTQSFYKSRSRYNCTNMIVDLLKEPSGKFHNFSRIRYEDFELLLNKIGPQIQKKDTHLRLSIPAKERLAVTLRYLASSDSYQSLSFLFKISPQIISVIVPEVCQELIIALSEHLKTPQSPAEWKKIAQVFEERWNFPHCCGAIDGKHVILEYFNYKSTFSINLMALCDADYCITYANIGSPGRMSDGGVFYKCKLSEHMEMGTINFPPDDVIINTSKVLPYVIVGDNAFPLKTNIMVPYPGIHDKGSSKRIYNYRLSRARRMIENVFGIMASVFRIFRTSILLNPEKANVIVQTCVLLHNFLRRSKTSRNSYTPTGTFDVEVEGNFVAGSWRNDNDGITSFKPLKMIARKSKNDAEKVRLEFANHFSTTGQVSWQNEY